MTAQTKNLRFWDNNFVSLEVFDDSKITFSSAQTSFPARNAANTSRSKVWRPAGNFEIVLDSNDLLYINDGSDKTITLTAASYTFDTLATHMQTQLNATSSGWVVSYDSTTTFTFTISNSGSVTLKLSTTTESVWDDIGFETGVDRTGTSFEADQQRNHTSEWYQLDAGIPVTLASFAVIGLIDEVFNLSTNATIKFQGNNVNNWDAPDLDRTVARSDRGLFDFLDDLDISPRTYRYWRFYYEDKLNSLGPEGVSIGVVYIGDYTTTTDTNVAAGFALDQTDPSRALESESGARFFEVRTKYHRIQNLRYQVMFQDDRLLIEQMYNDFGRTDPLFVSIDPTVSVSPTLEEWTYYVNFESASFLSLFRDKFQLNISLREAV